MNYRLITFALCAFTLLMPRNSLAEVRQYCVVCKGPDQTYLCQVNISSNSSSKKGLQLYCIIKISKEGGHKSCAIKDDTSAICANPIRTYKIQAPVIPPQLRSAVEKLRKTRNDARDDQEKPPKQKGGEPKTLIDMTGRAVKASRKGLKNTKEAVSGAASTTTQKVGNAARGAGKGVTKTARKVGSATKKTGGAVGNAAKSAFDCLKSWFRECGKKSEDAPPAPQ